MKRFFKWLGIGLGSLVGLVAVALAVAYMFMERRLNTVYDIEGTAVVVPDDAASIAEGARLARLRGCNGGCHGEVAGGNVFFEVPDGSRIVAPDLGRIAQDYTVAELERAIRHGIRPDGTSVIAIMPSSMFHWLTDDDLGKIMAFLATQDPAHTPPPEQRVGPLMRAMLYYYENKYDWKILAAERIDESAPPIVLSPGDELAFGEYLARTVCTECHGDKLEGAPATGIPGLGVIAAYSLDDFVKLMRTGKPIGDRKLELMEEVALGRFAHFSEEEIDALYAYLQAFASG